MSQLIDFVTSMTGLLVSMLIGVAWLGLRPTSRGGRRWLTVIAITYTCSSIYAVPFTVGRILVVGIHPLTSTNASPGSEAIVVLGAGSHTVEDWDQRRFSTLDSVGAARVLETVRVYQLLRNPWVISSGGADGNQVRRPDAAVMQEALIQLGVAPSRLLIEDRSRNTHDEAVLVAPMLRSLKIDRIILVTSDIHMRRSLGAFRAQGMIAIPAIARDPFLSGSWGRWIVPTREGLDLTSDVMHEFLGLAYYAVRGWLQF